MKCETTDPNLLRSLRDLNDNDAWVQFDNIYRIPIVNHCRSVGLNADQTDEVVQECFIKCFRYLPSFEYSAAVGRFRAWLNLTVNQRIAEVFRNSIRSQQVKDAYAVLIRDFNAEYINARSCPSAFEYELISMTFRRTRTEVDSKNWQIFEAYAIHGLSSKEVAQQFGVTAVSVRVTTHRVRIILQRNWKSLQEGPF